MPSPPPTRSWSPSSIIRIGIPPEQRFDPEKLASDLRGRGTAARMIPDVESIVAHVVERVQPGDCVVIFSTGGFGGVHETLLHALGNPVMPARPEAGAGA